MLHDSTTQGRGYRGSVLDHVLWLLRRLGVMVGFHPRCSRLFRRQRHSVYLATMYRISSTFWNLDSILAVGDALIIFIDECGEAGKAEKLWEKGYGKI